MAENIDNNSSYKIPKYDALRQTYDGKWMEEKEKFYNKLKENFQSLTTQFRTGRQVIYELAESQYSSHYEKAFRELFADTGYQATVGEIERLGSGTTKTRKLFIRLPDCYNKTI